MASSSLAAFPATRSSLVFWYNRRIDAYVKSGSLQSAMKLFDKMPERDVVSWNMMIAGQARCGLPMQALNAYKEMLHQGYKENPSTFSSVLSICSGAGFFLEGLQLHSRVISLGFASNLFVGCALVDLYGQSRLPDLAFRLFDELPDRNTAAWNSVLRGHCRFGRPEELLELYLRMKTDGVEPNNVTFSYLIDGCCKGELLEQGQQFHSQIIKLGWVQSNQFIANALVDLYSTCGCLIEARRSFEQIPVEDVISWNSIVSVHAGKGLLLEAINLFNRMGFWGKRPSVRSLVSLLTSSSRAHNLPLGEQTHGFVVKLGLDCSCVYTQSSLIDMYGKCDKPLASVRLFEEIPNKSTESCNSLMTAFLQCGHVGDAAEVFGWMVDQGIKPDQVTFPLAMKAISCSTSPSLTNSLLLHCCLVKSGFEWSTTAMSSLIDAYSKSGHIDLAQKVLGQIPAPNAICYTAFITGCARNGRGRDGLEMLEAMIQRGQKPDAVTFLCVLAGCDHAGLVEEGRWVFRSMKEVHGIEPDQRHYACMVNLLGRAGLLEEAEEMLKLGTQGADSVMWSSLLRSCRFHGERYVGGRAAKALMELEPENAAICSQLLGFYSEIGDAENLKIIREKMVSIKVGRGPGFSLLEVTDWGHREPIQCLI